MKSDRRPKSPRSRRAADVLGRYREQFGRTSGDDTSFAGSMWHIVTLAHLALLDLEAMLRGTGLTPPDLFVLMALLIEDDADIRPSDLARILSLSAAAISQRIAKLHESGLVIRRRDERDRRIVRIALTPRGAALGHALNKRFAQKGRFALSYAKLPPSDAAELERLLAVLAEEMTRHLARR